MTGTGIVFLSWGRCSKPYLDSTTSRVFSVLGGVRRARCAMPAFVRIRVLGRKAPGLERFLFRSVSSYHASMPHPPSQGQGCRTGRPRDSASARSVRSGVSVHARLQHGATRLGWAQFGVGERSTRRALKTMRRWGSSGMPKAYLGPGVTSRSTVWLWAGTLLVRRWRSSVPVQSGGPGIDGRLNRVSLV